MSNQAFLEWRLYELNCKHMPMNFGVVKHIFGSLICIMQYNGRWSPYIKLPDELRMAKWRLITSNPQETLIPAFVLNIDIEFHRAIADSRPFSFLLSHLIIKH